MPSLLTSSNILIVIKIKLVLFNFLHLVIMSITNQNQPKFWKEKKKKKTSISFQDLIYGLISLGRSKEKPRLILDQPYNVYTENDSKLPDHNLISCLRNSFVITIYQL